MIIEPKIRSNVFTNAHPEGCRCFVKSQIDEVMTKSSFEGPKNVLIIGGSSGYGLSSRIALAFGANANTVNVSFESAPKGKRTGTAGWWNNVAFQSYAKKTGNTHKDFIGDAFSKEMKEDVAAYIKKTFGKIDLLIYSLAAGARKDEKTGELIRSSIKTVDEPVTGQTIDIAKREVKTLSVEPATDDEIANTVFVMGGDDWQSWIEHLGAASLLDKGFKTISYTYVGGETTDKLYRSGSIGKAKEDLEKRASLMHEHLQEKYEGEALISSSKAVVTKASVFIPQMPIYVACLYDVMMEAGVHETILEHKYRLFKDMVYGSKREVDAAGRLRLDAYEMRKDIQEKVQKKMANISDEELFALKGTQVFLKEFYQMNGFAFEQVDYKSPVNLEQFSTLKPE